ncbi:hypothetical protein MMC25_000469 [Agyrium rufum]|nr:hypothetical protein [Agyrium rufum]
MNGNPGGRANPLPNGPASGGGNGSAINNYNGGLMNGAGGPGGGPGGVANGPTNINAGQQMDVNLIYQRLAELGDVLRDNRKRTDGIVNGAEELAARAAATGSDPSIREASEEIHSSRVADLTRLLNAEQHKTRILRSEQRENTRLIGEYETEIGNVVDMIRNYVTGLHAERNTLCSRYNKLLQDERDAHLETRAERDEFHARFMDTVGMLRVAHRIRCEEEDGVAGIVSALQSEVRSLRNVAGLEKEKFEEETGYEVLRHVVHGEGEPYPPPPKEPVVEKPASVEAERS